MAINGQAGGKEGAGADTAYHIEREEFGRKLYENPGMLPHRYVFVLTNLCNLRCPFCFQKKEPLAESLTTRQWLALIDQLPDYGWVTLTGGEPLVFGGFKEVFRKAAGRHQCNVISNALRLDEKTIELLLSEPNFRVLSVSLDDVGNRVRGVTPAEWARTEKMLQLFVQRARQAGRGALLDVKSVVLDENAADMLELHRYCMEVLRCDTHAFQLLKGAPIQYADVMHPPEAMARTYEAVVYERWDLIVQQLEAVRQYGQRTGTRCFLHPRCVDLNGAAALDPALLSVLNQPAFHAASFAACRVPWESMHINVDGNVFPCMAISMGNVKTHSLKEIVSGSAFRSFREVIRAQGVAGGCNRCGNLKACGVAPG